MNPQSQIYSTMAPWPGQDDGDEGRQRRGLAIAAITKIERNRTGYEVPSQSGNGTYMVSLDDAPFCTCPDFEKRQEPCKHIYAVEFIIQREERPNGITIETKTMRVTYGQDWPAYNAAQTHEQELFGQLLRELCDAIPNRPRGWDGHGCPCPIWSSQRVRKSTPPCPGGGP